MSGRDSAGGVATLALVVAAVAPALRATPAWAARPIAFEQPGLQAKISLKVSVPDVSDGGLLPAGYTADGRNLSPPVSWSEGPPGTVDYVVIMEDADAPSDPVRWVVYGIARGVSSLPRGLHNLAEPTRPTGAAQGRNDHGGFGYAGPRPTPGEPPHHYHLQVFALDRQIRVRPGAELARVEQGMWGHVLARGELVVTYPAAPGAKAPPAAAPPT